MKASTRRNLLLSSAGLAAFASMGQLSSCSSSTAVIPAVLDVITKAVAGACQIIPIVATLVDVIVAVFPTAAGVATITDALAQQIAQYVCNLFHTAGFEAGKHPLKSLSAKVGDKQIELHGFMVVNGSLTYI